MAFLFKERGILDTFSNRNIVWKYECVDSGTAGIFLNVYFDFGRNGVIQFKRTLLVKEHLADVYTEAEKFMEVVRRFRTILENLNSWILSDSMASSFCDTVLDVYPTVVFGSRKKNDIQVVFMGLETNHLMIKFTRAKSKELDRVMGEKIDSMVAVLNKFLSHCEKEFQPGGVNTLLNRMYCA